MAKRCHVVKLCNELPNFRFQLLILLFFCIFRVISISMVFLNKYLLSSPDLKVKIISVRKILKCSSYLPWFKLNFIFVNNLINVEVMVYRRNR